MGLRQMQAQAVKEQEPLFVHFTARWNSTSIVILYVLFVLMMLYHLVVSLNKRVRYINLAVHERVPLTFMHFTV